ncbi:hypothetical protein K1W69_22620 [Hoeflea sp. WL0058]|uniref:Uncharacterized protein n=1 Tax=Flavimaribacter sediminis TaxID=2865987 RepID=A0AAE2ZUR3_9HYPH|nr:hypothetical protein [Flavimaribacter sediminis]MBW8640007.1 hypothetical protein [Flavimaribacter sediminis]
MTDDRMPADYPDLFTYNKRSVLPPSLQQALKDVGPCLKSGTVSLRQVAYLRDRYRTVCPSTMYHASSHIRQIAEIWENTPYAPTIRAIQKPLIRLGALRSSPFQQIRNMPDLAWLYLFHGSGYVREASLSSIQTAPLSAFEYAAIAYRLNDWVAQVRDAALDCAERVLGKADPAIAAEFAFKSLDLIGSRGRMSAKAKDFIYSVILKPDVLLPLRNRILSERTSFVGRTFRSLLPHPEFDDHLQIIACQAVSPSARAIAMRTLLSGEAKWVVGYDMNHDFIRSPRFEVRPVSTEFGYEGLLSEAASDNASAVRKVAADMLIAHRHKTTTRMDEIAEVLSMDHNAAVRSRIDFYFRQGNK